MLSENGFGTEATINVVKYLSLGPLTLLESIQVKDKSKASGSDNLCGKILSPISFSKNTGEGLKEARHLWLKQVKAVAQRGPRMRPVIQTEQGWRLQDWDIGFPWSCPRLPLQTQYPMASPRVTVSLSPLIRPGWSFLLLPQALNINSGFVLVGVPFMLRVINLPTGLRKYWPVLTWQYWRQGSLFVPSTQGLISNSPSSHRSHPYDFWVLLTCSAIAIQAWCGSHGAQV